MFTFCCSYVKLEITFQFQPNSIILAISPANQDIATFDAIKLTKEVDPLGERTFGVWTKLDLIDKGTNALDVLEGRAYRLQHPWVGIVNRSQADIIKNTDMIYARRMEQEYFYTSTDYGHLASKMGSEYLAKLLSQHLESVIKAKIPGIISLINKGVEEMEAELDRLGRPIAVDDGVGKTLSDRKWKAASQQVLKESFKIYYAVIDEITNLIDKIPRHEPIKALDLHKRAG